MDYIEICKENMALQQENKQLKEQLAEQIDYKDEYYHYWQETKKQLAIREKALKNMHEMIKIYVKELFNEDAFSIEHFIEQAKESMK